MLKIALLIAAVGIIFAAITITSFRSSTIPAAAPVPPPTAELPPATPPPSPAKAEVVKNGMHTITISTSFGDIKIETYDADAPKTVKNFIALAEKGFYNGLAFHRIVPGFVIQGGDPKGNGTGGPGYTFEDELNPATPSYRRGYEKGTVAMANAGPNTNGSQFFIMLAHKSLPHLYTIFGRVISGQETVDAIARVKTGPGDRPLQPVVMRAVSSTAAQSNE